MSEGLEQFRQRWQGRLNEGARTTFQFTERFGAIGLHSTIADEFVVSLGLSGIGFNWELLDASPEASGERAALTQLSEALAKDISNPSRAWLGDKEARACASELLACFDPATRTVVSNRYDGLWNPISGAPVEWGFVCFDDHRIALLLITEA
ncbi:hypothetical protein ACI5KX_00590 [Erythrobacter sp. GH1-10]|uniref:hypothetical protein n=1 Tax=Erythrobacter sp. GH1-10 TaxID=3349334 RepID=UPI003877F59C